jgi:amino acid adenylation domain-containing protein
MVKHIVPVIQSHAIATPYKSALADTSIQLDYAELDSFSTRFAMRLRALGCKPQDRVVMLASRRAILVAGILGVFKAGCVHVPLDPSMPAERLRYILNDIAPSAVITEEEMADTVNGFLPRPAPLVFVTEMERLLTVDEESAQRDALVRPHALPELDEQSTAYCIYTSGSTGRPKGVQISHRSLFDFFDGTWPIYDVTAESRCASFSPLNFDVYTMDMLFPLAQGAHLHVYDDVVVPDILFETIRANRISHFSAWGMMLGLIAQAEDFATAELPHVRTILTGTDVPDIKTVQRWLRKNDGVKVINAYGPTEVTCAATAHVITEIEPDRTQLYPIGKPLKHVQALIVDEEGERIEAPGTPGELMLGGSQVMQGYWHMPEQTAQRLTHIDGVPFYRTGDICTWMEDGSIFYIGRKDNEVKLGGYRIHLSEIQRVINSVAHVHASEIVVPESRYGEKLLAAGVLIDRSQAVDVDRLTEEIRQRCAAELPAYMVPRYVTVLDQFPQLSSGKADRKALLSLLQFRINQPNQEEVNS